MKNVTPTDTYQMELLSDTLNLGANLSSVATFSPHGITFSPNATEQDVLSIGKRLFAVRSYTKWAIGSVFAEMVLLREQRLEKLRGEGRKREAKDLQGGLEWAGEFAIAHQLDPKEFREMLGVFTFYGVGDKEKAADLDGLSSLSFEHYREAMWGVDDGKPGGRQRAIGYLTKARDEGWVTVGPMRRHIRTSAATEQPEPTEQVVAAYAVIGDFRRWCAKELDQVEGYTAERVRLILDDLGDSTLSYIDALRDIAGGTSRRGTPPAFRKPSR